MNTIYWLAVFGAAVGIGMFLLSVVAVTLVRKYGDPLAQFAIDSAGFKVYRLGYLALGVACLIVIATL